MDRQWDDEGITGEPRLPTYEEGGAALLSMAAAEDVDFSTMPLPPLQEPVLPTTVENIDLSEIYQVITGMKRVLDVEDQEQEDEIRLNLMEDPQLLLAVVRVLHESHALKRLAVDVDGAQVVETVPLPIGAVPQLPPGIYSWLPQQQQQQPLPPPPAFPYPGQLYQGFPPNSGYQQQPQQPYPSAPYYN